MPNVDISSKNSDSLLAQRFSNSKKGTKRVIYRRYQKFIKKSTDNKLAILKMTNSVSQNYLRSSLLLKCVY